MKRWIEIQPTKKLQGSVQIPGSKNSALGLIAATCLSNDTVTLKGVPDLLDVRTIQSIAEEIGLQMRWVSDSNLFLDPTEIINAQLDPIKTSAFRASYYFVGALLAKYKRVSIGYPGGDDFGSRPIDQHIKGLKALGAKVETHRDYYVVKAAELKGTEIFFDVITSGATINLMLAGTLAKGRTILGNAARDPEVVDVANLLNKMGAKHSCGEVI
ncbi:UDP-N-acetylglucosamine 1-carboxyvinyltransferase [Pseudalkalibacillus caeni]|uniref:UDP-N-acetylglucosamine 1-carboxyvinyltransferase n=1 Tax=Exobacillus caeni TaxID=2574798 RepID=A0A5R9EXF8_9BACL|nr:hypothetical protein [Pseudalkalibacillus caeni]TLS35229.1 hypothetical protein FCL54_21770 [Pseudalkalibacillus caeni]